MIHVYIHTCVYVYEHTNTPFCDGCHFAFPLLTKTDCVGVRENNPEFSQQSVFLTSSRKYRNFLIQDLKSRNHHFFTFQGCRYLVKPNRIFFFFFGQATQLDGSQFPGLNPGHIESTKSQTPDCQEIPLIGFLK